MSITGNLRTLEISELLQWLAHGRKSGALLIEKEGSEKQIWFDEGRIIGSASSSPSEHLSRVLVDRGLVDQATMARALKLQEATQILLGRVLVTLGSLGEGDLRRILQTKTEETSYELFDWPEGDFRFVGDGVPEQPMIPISLDVTNLVLEGMHRIDELRQKEPTDEGAGSDLPPEVLETQIIPPMRDLAPEADPEPEAQPPAEEAAPPEAIEVAAVAASEESEETELDVAEPYAPDAPDAGGYYQTIPAKKMDRKSLYGVVAGAVVLLLAVIGGIYYFSSRNSTGEEADPTQVADLAATPGPAMAQPLEPESGELEAGILTGEAGDGAGDNGETSAAVVPPDKPPAVPEERASAADLEARARKLAEAQASAREDELRREYESELETLRAQLEEAQQEPADTEQAESPATEGAGAPPTDSAAEPGSTQVDGTEAAPERPSPAPPPQQAVPAAQTEPPVRAEPPPPAEPEPEPEPPAVPEPEPPAVQRGDLVEPGVGVIPAAMIQPPKPRYPPAARRLRREAVAEVRVLVDEDGKVEKVERTGKKLGMGFDEAAEDAARRTTWSPATKDGVPVKMWVNLRIEFQP